MWLTACSQLSLDYNSPQTREFAYGKLNTVLILLLSCPNHKLKEVEKLWEPEHILFLEYEWGNITGLSLAKKV